MNERGGPLVRLARNRDRLNAQRVADLTLRAAAALVSEPAAADAPLDRVQRAGQWAICRPKRRSPCA